MTWSWSVLASSSSAAVIVLAATICIGPFSDGAAAAQEYSFSVQYERLDVHVLKDGSVDINYLFGMTNYAYLDGVDIGLPNDHYDLDSAEAKIFIEGSQYRPSLIHESPYIEVGVAVEFSDQVIQLLGTYGTSFALEFHINNPRMVYENEQTAGTVGVAVRPTWFDSTFQQGPTDELTTRVFFPEGFTNVTDAVYLEGHPWDEIGVDSASGLIVANWSATSVDPSAVESGTYDFGAGFPAEFVDSYVKPSIWDGVSDLFSSVFDLACMCTPIWIIAGTILLGVLGDRAAKAARRKDYFKPSLGVVGAGPRRDLTAVEAAVVLERPLEMVATMILFGLVKKGAVRIESDEKPMRLTKLRTVGDHAYENDYLEAIDAGGGMNSESLEDTLVNLVNATGTKLEGFDCDSTKSYYEEICDAAWRQVREAGTPEAFASTLSDKHEWMMLDKGYDKRMRGHFAGVPYTHVPLTYFAYRNAPTAAGVSPKDLASNYASSVRDASGRVVSDFKALASKVSGRTNTVAVVPTSGGSRHKGGGGIRGFRGGRGCACACACACAGGGR